MENNYIHFFGTTGDKALIFSNKRSTGGVYICIDGVKVMFDPGPGTLNKFVMSYPNMISSIDAIVLSHVHFDHSNDFNIFIEGMTNGGDYKRGAVLAPRQALQEEDGVINNYLRSFPERIIEVNPQTEYVVNNLKIKSSILLHHGTENYGYTFSSDNHVITFMTDTAYFDGLAESYPQSDILVVNVPYASVPSGKKMKHLSLDSIPHIIKCIKPQKVFLTHFGESMLNANPEECAKALSKELLCDVVAVDDNKKYILS
jgi:phosphoribosyl 1,2-cyclic phosphodiesterase